MPATGSAEYLPSTSSRVGQRWATERVLAPVASACAVTAAGGVLSFTAL